MRYKNALLFSSCISVLKARFQFFVRHLASPRLEASRTRVRRSATEKEELITAASERKKQVVVSSVWENNFLTLASHRSVPESTANWGIKENVLKQQRSFCRSLSYCKDETSVSKEAKREINLKARKKYWKIFSRTEKISQVT